ncbi:MAG: polyprenyl synthetase family protein [Syntrophaceticus sp.]|nr:polyprenyl synthetase family protein [Syntrophaceticus sp.]MDD3314535.1 polyprenyl synthetase family protein [Syntrophaceticus sp.]
MDIFNHQGITYYRQGDTICNNLIGQLQQKGILMSTLVLEIAIDFQPLLEKAEQRLQEAVNQGGAYGTSGTCGTRGTIGNLAAQIIKAGGKRLRPLLVILSGWKEDGDCDSLLDVAVAAELLHTASLIHDDIIDKADNRRGIPTLNVIKGQHTAVITGDYLFARALTLLSEQNTNRALPCLIQSIESMCEGIIEEINSVYNPAITEQDYLSRIDKKTASLVAACCEAGARIRGASPPEVDAHAAFGHNLGMCFQIVDDILDFTADEKTLGKPADSDFSQGILTLPVIYLLQDSNWSQPVRRILAKRSCTNDELSYVKKGIHKTASLQLAYEKALQYQDKAKACLASFPTTPEPVRSIFHKLTEMVMERIK